MAAEVGPIGEAIRDAHYVHDQSVPSATWTIVHNMDKRPSVSIVNTLEQMVLGEVSYPDADTVVVTFTNAFAGKAYLN